MLQKRIWTIRNLLSLHSFVVQLPKYSKMPSVTALQEQQNRSFSVHGFLTQAATTKTDEQKTKKLQQKITLIGQNQAMSITTLEEAQKLAKRRDLHLLKMNQTDAKTGRIMFKMVSAAEMLADDQESKVASADKGNKKSEKSLSIGARITDHDLASRLKNIVKWLNKRHEVRILIQGSVGSSDDGNAERIVKAIEKTVKEPETLGKIVQKRQKGGHIKFSILPVAQATTESTTTPTSPDGKQS